jgi:hypothetical protein
MGLSLSPYAKKNGFNGKNTKKAAHVVCRQWKIIGKKCDISAVVQLQVVFMICLKNCAAVIVINQLQNDRSID